MHAEINYKGYKAMCEWGYVAEKDIELIVLAVDNKATAHRGSVMPNLVQYSFNMGDKGKICHLELAVNYAPKQISELIKNGDIDPPENLEKEVYSASLSAHSRNPGYLDNTIKWLNDTLGWINIKKDIPELKIPMQMTLKAHMNLIDEIECLK